MENPMEIFQEKMNLVLQLIEELQMKYKTAMIVFSYIYFVRVNLFDYLCFFSIYSILNKRHDLLPHYSHSTN